MCEIILRGRAEKRDEKREVSFSIIRRIYQKHISKEKKEFGKEKQKTFKNKDGRYFVVWEYEKGMDRDRIIIKEIRIKGKPRRW